MLGVVGINPIVFSQCMPIKAGILLIAFCLMRDMNFHYLNQALQISLI
jgi:hypothetical protein